MAILAQGKAPIQYWIGALPWEGKYWRDFPGEVSAINHGEHSKTPIGPFSSGAENEKVHPSGKKYEHVSNPSTDFVTFLLRKPKNAGICCSSMLHKTNVSTFVGERMSSTKRSRIEGRACGSTRNTDSSLKNRPVQETLVPNDSVIVVILQVIKTLKIIH
jgi:hypothetical protein